MNREVVDKWCERGILSLVLAILVFTPLAFGGRPQPPAGVFFDFLLLDMFQVVQWLTVAVLVIWGIRLAVNPRPRLLWPPICWAVLAFTVYAVIRYFTADIEYAARQECIHVLVYAFLFFAILNHLHRQESMQIISLTLVFLAMAISCYAVFQFFTHSTRVWHVFTQYRGRASGTYICPNHLGGFLELLLPLALAYTIAGRLKALTKIFLGYATLVILAGMATTISRGTWLATIFAMLVFFGVLLCHRSYRLPAFLLLIFLIGTGFVFMPRNYSTKARFKRLFIAGKIDDDLRFFMWEPAAQVWRENIWWGSGPAHFDYRFRQHRPESVQLSPDRVHNDFLNVLADWGLAGAAIISAAWVLLALGVWKTWKVVSGAADLGGKQSSNKYAFVLGAAVGLIAILAHALVDFNMYIPANALLVVTLMALLSSNLRFATDRYWLRIAPWGKGTIGLFLLGGVVYLSQQGSRRAAENYWLARFNLGLPEAYSPAQVAVLKKAFTIEPKNFDTTYALGEAYRVQSLEGGEDFVELAAEAMKWFELGMKLNPWDGYNFLYYGWCLDWMQRQKEAEPYFSKAEALDPNGYVTMAYIGRHFVELKDFAAAKPWFERSLKLEWTKVNKVAWEYLPIVNRKLAENATNEISARLSIPVP